MTFYDKEKKKSIPIFVFCFLLFFFLQKSQQFVVPHLLVLMFLHSIVFCWYSINSKTNMKHCIFICSKTKVSCLKCTSFWRACLLQHMCARFFLLPAYVLFADTSHSFFLFLLQSEWVYANEFVSDLYGHYGRHFSCDLVPSIGLL
jgi:hypothetical protein